MKKVMIGSGTFSVGLLTLGILFKVTHWPGAAVILFLGIVTLSFVFLPLLFALRMKEKEKTSEKAIVGIGMLAAVLISIGILFKIMHWPFADLLSGGALGLMLFLFIPVYFFTGIKNPATKVNTIVSSILMVAGCALVITLIRIPVGTRKQYVANTEYFLRNEQIVNAERALSGLAESEAIYTNCQELKAFFLEQETGFETLDSDFESKEALIGDTYAQGYVKENPEILKKIEMLGKQIQDYNTAHTKEPNFITIPQTAIVFGDIGRVKEVLNELTQIQMIFLQNQRSLVAMK